MSTITKMDPEVKARWVAALRSGDYEQGAHALRTNDNRYCCLGVLCDVVDPAGWSSGGGHRCGINSYLPSSVAREVGLSTRPEVPDPRGEFGGDRVGLDILNDSSYSFAQIADLIEEHL